VFLLFSGYSLLLAFGVARTARVVFAITAGLCIYIGMIYLQIVLHIPTYPLISLAIISLLMALFLIRGHLYKRIKKEELAYLLVCAVVILVISVICDKISLIKFHYDSLRYLIVSSLLASDRFDALTVNLLTKRLSSIAILNSPAHLSGSYYFPALLPVAAINLLAVMFYVVFAGVSRVTHAAGGYLVAAASVILLLSINRFVWNGFYLNDHLLEALCLVTVVGGGWLGALKALPTSSTSVVQAVATIGVVMSRPEGFIMAGLALFPTLLSEDVPSKRRVQLACVWAVSIIIQHAAVLVWWPVRPHGFLEAVALGVAIVVLSPALLFGWITRHALRILVAAEMGLWLMLAVLAASDRRIFYVSFQAAMENFVHGQGAWGWSIMVLAGLIAAAALFTNAPERIFIRFPLTSFVPVAFILALLRGGPYRVGTTDSLNRMIFHVVPLAILFLASAATSPGFSQRLRKKSSGHG